MSLLVHWEEVTKCFSKIPNHITQGLGNISSKAKVLFIFLYSQSPSYKPTIDGLAHTLWEKGKKQSRSAIERSVVELKEAGLLEIEKVAFKEYKWHLYDPNWKRTDKSSK